MLIYSDNRLVDPWLVSHLVVQSTRSLAPLVAVQPADAHPYTVAKTIATFAALHGRRLFINGRASRSGGEYQRVLGLRIEGALLDSLGLVRLLVELEREFGIEVDVADLELEDFGSVSRIARYV